MNLDGYLERISFNDTEAFNELYNLINTNVYSFALSILKNHDDALDVTQETFISIYHNVYRYQNQGKPMAWILTITKNLAYMKIKKKKKEVDITNIEFKTTDNYDKILINYLLENLNDLERQIIVLHSLNGFKFHEIAGILDLKLTTTLSKYHIAIKKLKELMKEEK